MQPVGTLCNPTACVPSSVHHVCARLTSSSSYKANYLIPFIQMVELVRSATLASLHSQASCYTNIISMGLSIKSTRNQTDYLAILVLHLLDSSFHLVQGLDGNAGCYIDTKVAHELCPLRATFMVRAGASTLCTTDYSDSRNRGPVEQVVSVAESRNTHLILMHVEITDLLKLRRCRPGMPCSPEGVSEHRSRWTAISGKTLRSDCLHGRVPWTTSRRLGRVFV